MSAPRWHPRGPVSDWHTSQPIRVPFALLLLLLCGRLLPLPFLSSGEASLQVRNPSKYALLQPHTLLTTSFRLLEGNQLLPEALVRFGAAASTRWSL